jgi:hypothetical protein
MGSSFHLWRNCFKQSKYKDVSGNWGFENYTEYMYNSANQLEDEDRWKSDGKLTEDEIYHTEHTYDAAGNMTSKDLDNRPGVGVDEAWDYVYNGSYGRGYFGQVQSRRCNLGIWKLRQYSSNMGLP